MAGQEQERGEVTERLRKQAAAASTQSLPAHFSQFGGWTAKRFEATGFFRTAARRHSAGGWSIPTAMLSGPPAWTACGSTPRPTTTGWRRRCLAAGPRTVQRSLRGTRIEARQHQLPGGQLHPRLWARLVRSWTKIALAELRRLGFNTVGNWSDWQIAREARLPVRAAAGLGGSQQTPHASTAISPMSSHPSFEEDARSIRAAACARPAGRPGLHRLLPDERADLGILERAARPSACCTTRPSAHARQELARFLEAKYADDASAGQGVGGCRRRFDEVARGRLAACRSTRRHARTSRSSARSWPSASSRRSARPAATSTPIT